MSLKFKNSSLGAAFWLLGFTAAVCAQVEPPRLISTRSAVLPQARGAAGDSGLEAVTPDGRWVLFSSTAENLLPQGAPADFASREVPGVPNLFLHNRSNRTTVLVSVSTNGAAAERVCVARGISTNGSVVIFETAARNLHPLMTREVTQVYAWDGRFSSNTLVSGATNGAPANGECWGSVVSADGRFVAFVSQASNLVTNDINGIPDIFVRDLAQGTTALATPGSRRPFGASSGISFGSDAPALSADGRYLAFLSTAQNVVPPPNGPPLNSASTTNPDLYLRDLQTSQTEWVTRNTRGLLLSSPSMTLRLTAPLLSNDGERVAYRAAAQSGSSRVFLFSAPEAATRGVYTNSLISNLDVTAELVGTPDLATLAFTAQAVSVPREVRVWSEATGTAALVSLDRDGRPAPGYFRNLSLADSGAVVAFASTATNLTPAQVAPGYHLYVRDLESGTNIQVDAALAERGAEILGSGFNRLDASAEHVFFAAREPEGMEPQTAQVFACNVKSNSLELVSLADTGFRPETPSGGSGFGPLSLSRNGQFVAFYSSAPDLAAGDTNGAPDLFLHDLWAGTNVLLSSSGGGDPANNLSVEPSVNADGQVVAFSSAASDLAQDDTNLLADVFVRRSGTNYLASFRAATGLPDNKASFGPVLSEDGTKLLFRTYSAQIAPVSSYVASSTAYPDLVYRDLARGTVLSLGGRYGASAAPSITPDGRLVAFVANTVSLSTGDLVLYDVDAGTRTVVVSGLLESRRTAFALDPTGRRLVYAINAFIDGGVSWYDLASRSSNFINSIQVPRTSRFAFSQDGNAVVYAGAPGNPYSLTNQVFVYDFVLHANTQVSPGGPVNAPIACDGPDISPGGRFVAYRAMQSAANSTAASLTAAIRLFDRASRSTVTLHTAPGLTLGQPRFSGDGSSLVFLSRGRERASDLNAAADLYAWQIAEGELPLIYTRLSRADSGVLLTWPIKAGRTYKVQYKHDLADPDWIDITEGVVLEKSQGKFLDPALAAQRFYRILAQ